MGDNRLRASGLIHQFRPPPCRPPFTAKGNDAAGAVRHVFLCQLVILAALQAGVVDPGDLLALLPDTPLPACALLQWRSMRSGQRLQTPTLSRKRVAEATAAAPRSRIRWARRLGYVGRTCRTAFRYRLRRDRIRPAAAESRILIRYARVIETCRCRRSRRPAATAWPSIYLVVECVTISDPAFERAAVDRGRERVVHDQGHMMRMRGTGRTSLKIQSRPAPPGFASVSAITHRVLGWNALQSSRNPHPGLRQYRIRPFFSW